MRVLWACTLALLLLLSGCSGSTANKSSAPPGKPADEAAAIEMLKQIHAGQTDFIRRTRRYAMTTDELVRAFLLKENPSPEKTGYDFLLLPSPDAVSFTVAADPQDAASTARHFFIDQTGKIRAEMGKRATAASPEI